MKRIFATVIFWAILIACSDSKKDIPRTVPAKKMWYEGGTLHRAKISEWKNATEENKLATCGDFMATLDNSVSVDVLLDRAKALRACINEATNGIDNVDNDNVSEIASLCTVALGYKK